MNPELETAWHGASWKEGPQPEVATEAPARARRVVRPMTSPERVYHCLEVERGKTATDIANQTGLSIRGVQMSLARLRSERRVSQELVQETFGAQWYVYRRRVTC